MSAQGGIGEGFTPPASGLSKRTPFDPVLEFLPSGMELQRRVSRKPRCMAAHCHAAASGTIFPLRLLDPSLMCLHEPGNHFGGNRGRQPNFELIGNTLSRPNGEIAIYGKAELLLLMRTIAFLAITMEQYPDADTVQATTSWLMIHLFKSYSGRWDGPTAPIAVDREKANQARNRSGPIFTPSTE